MFKNNIILVECAIHSTRGVLEWGNSGRREGEKYVLLALLHTTLPNNNPERPLQVSVSAT
jgi:hypothetical protein